MSPPSGCAHSGIWHDSAMPIQRDFIQSGPEVSVNTYESDRFLKLYLTKMLPTDIFTSIEADLIRFGSRCGTDVLRLSQSAERNPPKHVPFDEWGRRIDKIEVSEAWVKLDEVAATEGLIAIGYERKQKEFSRLYQFTKLYLFHPSSAFYSCPLAMTDGAARVIELHGSSELKVEALTHLTSRDPKKFWTSGQWMTERTGGSDVSGTSTVASASDVKGKYVLSGDKWFTSATTAQMAMALAKVEGATDTREGLSLFYLRLHDEQGRLKNIKIHRLKDKLGTHALPTAELILEDAKGELVGEVGEGVKRVSSLLNITRIYNSVCSLGAMSRGLALARDYAKKRTAFGSTLEKLPLHLKTLADLTAEFQVTFVFCFHLIHLLGREELGVASDSEKSILRLMTPVIKLWSAKQAVLMASEVLESFGGAGYIEDTDLPRLLRDAQVFAIWEGTTNVLSLDALRAIAKDNPLEALFYDIEQRLASVQAQNLAQEVAKVRAAVTELKTTFAGLTPKSSEAAARSLSFGLARIYGASLYLEFAAKSNDVGILETARQFCEKPLFLALPSAADLNTVRLHSIVFGS